MKETGIEIIAKERQRQIEQEGFDAKHDKQNVDGRLAMAAVCYALPDGQFDGGSGAFCKKYWPWDWSWFKPGVGAYPASRIRELAKAGALIAAEIDRLKTL
jgi:hypothetical protein